MIGIDQKQNDQLYNDLQLIVRLLKSTQKKFSPIMRENYLLTSVNVQEHRATSSYKDIGVRIKNTKEVYSNITGHTHNLI